MASANACLLPSPVSFPKALSPLLVCSGSSVTASPPSIPSFASQSSSSQDQVVDHLVFVVPSLRFPYFHNRFIDQDSEFCSLSSLKTRRESFWDKRKERAKSVWSDFYRDKRKIKYIQSS